MSKIVLQQVVGRTLSIGRVSGTGAASAWGGIAGSIAAQQDLADALADAGETATFAGISGDPLENAALAAALTSGGERISQ